MAGTYRRGTDWLAVAVVIATLVVAAGALALGAEMYLGVQTPTPLPRLSDRAVLYVPTRAPTPTHFASPTPAPTATRAPTPTALPTTVPTATSSPSPVTTPSSAIIQAAARSVVQVKTASGTASAFRVEASGAARFVTTARGVGSASKVTLVTPDGKQHPATVSRRETSVDLALITASGVDAVPSLRLADEMPGVGSTVFVIGYAAKAKVAAPAKPVPGAVSVHQAVGTLRFPKTNAAINAGHSGGAVLSTAARAVGVACYGLRDPDTGKVQSGSYVIPAGIVLAFLGGAR